MLLEATCLDERLAEDHPARTIWAAAQRLDLTRFYEAIKARGETPGRPAIDPRLLVALWLLAATEGIGRGREVARLCQRDDAYRWLCGSVNVNYHTLNDFRVEHGAALDDLMSQILATLVFHGVVTVQRLSQDGLRVRASAGSASFRREKSLREQTEKMRRHIEALKQQGEGEGEGDVSVRQRSARARAARDRLARLERALEELPKVKQAKAKQKNKPSKQREPRVSTTDPEARVMKMPDGGFRPAYNFQFAVDPACRAIVGVDVTNQGNDAGLSEPMRAQVQQRTGQSVREHLMDGSYVTLKAIDEAAGQGVTIYAPLPKPRRKPPEAPEASESPESAESAPPSVDPDPDPHPHPGEPKPGDSEAVAEWRARMAGEEGQRIYVQRASTSETVNADLRTWRGMERLTVRGLDKVRCVGLWSALASNLMHFSAVLLL